MSLASVLPFFYLYEHIIPSSWPSISSYYRLPKPELEKEDRRKLEEATFIDETIKGVHPLECTYFLYLPHPLNPLFKSISIPQPDTECKLCYGSLLEGAGDPCESKESCQLPCGHVFGLECVKEVFCDLKRDCCPVCYWRYKIVRDSDGDDVNATPLVEKRGVSLRRYCCVW